MDAKQQYNVHPSFVEIIKQLTPFDAKVLSSLVYWSKGTVGVANVAMKPLEGTGHGIWFRNVFPFPDLTFENVNRYCASVDNLIRLSIIEVNYSSSYTNKDFYNSLTNSTFLTECEEHLEKVKRERGEINFESVFLIQGMWNFTTLGSNFISCCL
ncbi:Abi-alpha family protein [Paenibacillus sp. S02]|uniref:Abi-alpha family protein n=1 Tax=Paenibacillus sp. S02 TaxID=2823904 RepID=UPI001C65349E|nr:Abi-alpha family protein [Paenibacillus sp. S02]